MKIEISYFLSFVLVTSCVQKVKVKMEKNEIGGLTKKVTNEKLRIIVDSIFDFSGQLNTVMEYFKPGRIKAIKHYKNGIQDSTMLMYYSSGVVKSKRFFYSGKQCFERVDFSESGKLADYLFLSSDQSHFYMRSYDSLGHCINVNGVPFFESYIYSNRNSTFSIYDTVKAVFYVPIPPDCNVKLYTVYGDKEINNIRQIKKTFVYGVKIYPLSKGDYEWFVKMKIFDGKSDTLLYSSDLTKIEYKVR